jgi:translation initiation factor 1
MTKDARLVYSSDPKLNEKCPKCKELLGACICVPAESTASARAVLRIEKQGRGGKTVTVLARLPRNEAYLKELCSELKKRCGAGGTYLLEESGGRIEIQGDKREQLRLLLDKRGIPTKG